MSDHDSSSATKIDNFFFFFGFVFGIILEKEKGKTQRMCTSPIQRIQLNERVSIKYKKENIKGVLPRA